MSNNTFKQLILGASCALGLLVTQANAEEIVIKFSHVAAINSPKGQMGIKLQEIVEERLKGKVKVEVFPNSQLYSDSKVLEALLLGDVHLAAPALSKFKKYTKKLQVFDLPFLFKNMEAVERFQQSPDGQALLSSVQKKGLTGLGYFHNGLKQLSASQPLRVPGDAAGLKFRIMNSDVLAEQFQAVDASPLKKPYSEVFMLLQTKAIDGQENTWNNMYSKKFFEVQPYITESNHGLVDYMLVTSTEFWEGLPDDIRPVLKEAIKEAAQHGNKVAAELSMADRQKIIDYAGSEVLALSDEERQQWVDIMKPVWAKFEDEIGKDLIDAAMASNQ